jgi:enoyl-[acyl-carrier-protein] reductase (NADH)
MKTLKATIKKINSLDGIIFLSDYASQSENFQDISSHEISILAFEEIYFGPLSLLNALDEFEILKKGSSIIMASSLKEKVGKQVNGPICFNAAFSCYLNSMATSLANRGIRVNKILLAEEFFAALASKELGGESLEAFSLPVINVINFFISDASRFITGQTLIADSGSTLHQAIAL